MAVSHWMLVGTAENFRISRALGFTVQGIKSRHRKKAERMQPGDRIVYYLTGGQVFAGTATILSPYYEEHTPVWRSEKREGEDFPFRMQIEPNVILPEGAYIEAEALAPRLKHVQKWPAEHWRLAFQGNVHLIPEEDFRLIEEELAKAAGKLVSGKVGTK